MKHTVFLSWQSDLPETRSVGSPLADLLAFGP